jgi:large conductance mechanosensitive channel
MLKEFKEFALRGNVIDLAVGVIIGVAFGAIVTSLVNDVIMPPIGLLLGGLDFKDLFIALDGKPYATLEQARGAAAPVIAYGAFINSVVNFLIVAFSVFLVIRQVNRLKKPAAGEAVPPSRKDCPYCGMSIPAKAVRCPDCTSELKAAA